MIHFIGIRHADLRITKLTELTDTYLYAEIVSIKTTNIEVCCVFIKLFSLIVECRRDYGQSSRISIVEFFTSK